MLDALIVPLFVTTDLPPGADLAEFGEIVAEAARSLDRDGLRYDGFLVGRVFWLDRPVLPGQRPPSRTEMRFAGLLGYLAAAGEGHTARQVVADLRRAVAAVVAARFGETGAPVPAVFAIRDRDVRERTPEGAMLVDTRDAVADLVTAARAYL
ncbi:hypothetical protein [Thermoactinospora rubra]|uniref:hypothetical protein n=1 Tax=Thermoactinospora rubra TaxID=1088767 RepID=UPI000A1166E4|nr:hypothetical protein [Thermoactinospora rubra]